MKYLYSAILILITNSYNAFALTGTSLIDTTTSFNAAVEGMPHYPGGMDSFNRYLEDNIKWPDRLYLYLYQTQSQVSSILVSFVVEKDGSLVDIKPIKDLGFGTFEEVSRVLKACPKWQPGTQDGRKVRVQFTLPINIPPPPVSSIRIDEPVGTPSYPFARYQDKQNFPAILVSGEKYMLRERLNNCITDSFFVEDEKIALSDRFSILQHVKESISIDSLKKLIGRVAFQIVVDTTGSACMYTYESNLNSAFKNYSFDTILTQKTKWNLLPLKSGQKKAVSVIVAITFTADQIIYQHFAPNFYSGTLRELERSVVGKISRY